MIYVSHLRRVVKAGVVFFKQEKVLHRSMVSRLGWAAEHSLPTWKVSLSCVLNALKAKQAKWLPECQLPVRLSIMVSEIIPSSPCLLDIMFLRAQEGRVSVIEKLYCPFVFFA